MGRCGHFSTKKGEKKGDGVYPYYPTAALREELIKGVQKA